VSRGTNKPAHERGGNLMRVLIYKRTHQGDPDGRGCFGIHECMGPVRAWDYDAVIGVGGIGREPQRAKIAGKVCWIGIGPLKGRVAGDGEPKVTFDHFVLFADDAPDFRDLAPTLAARMYDRNVRTLVRGMSAARAVGG